MQAIVNAYAHEGRWGWYGAGSGMQQSFNNADKVMSEANSNDGFSGATDAPVAEASVNAHGSGLGVVVSARGTHEDRETLGVLLDELDNHERYKWRIEYDNRGFVIRLEWLDADTADAATSTQESGKTTS